MEENKVIQEEATIEDIVDDMSNPIGIASSLLLPMRIFITEIARFNEDATHKILGSETFASIEDNADDNSKSIVFAPFDLEAVSPDLKGCVCKVVVNVFDETATFNVNIGYDQGSFLVFTQLIPQQDFSVIQKYMEKIPEVNQVSETLN